jgi:hypothetical protein
MPESNISKYFDDVAQSLMSNYKRFELLIPNTSLKKGSEETKGGSDHTGEEGRFLESVIRSFLNKHLPQNLRALSGFIIRPAALCGDNDTRRVRDQKVDKHSPQLDIIVYDIGNYPVFEQFDDFAIVPPEGVYAIISVKKQLRMDDIEHELKALAYAASLCHHYNKKEGKKIVGAPGNQRVAGPITALIGFKTVFDLNTTNSKKIFEKIRAIQGENPVDGIIKLISSIEEFSFFRADHRFEENKFRVPFLWIKHKIGNEEPQMNLTLQYLLHFILKLYYDDTRQPLLMKPGYNHFNESARKEKRFENFLIVEKQHFLTELEYNNAETVEEIKELKKDK